MGRVFFKIQFKALAFIVVFLAQGINALAVIDQDTCNELVRTFIAAQLAEPGYRELTDTQANFLKKYFYPAVGKRGLWHIKGNRKQKLRSCSVAGGCVVVSDFKGEPQLQINFENSEVLRPTVETTDEHITLSFPPGFDFERLPVEEGKNLVKRFLSGHSLHPYNPIKKGHPLAESVAEQRKSLEEPVLFRKKVQVDALEAIQGSIDLGHTEFLFVAPTGTGKTEVMMAMLEKFLSKKDSKKVYILIADRTNLVEQLAADATRFDDQAKIVKWGGRSRRQTLHEFLDGAAKRKKSTILATTIQSLTARFNDASPEEQLRLREMTQALAFDEAHHTGAPETREFIRVMRRRDTPTSYMPFLYGTTATPLHREQKIEELFHNRAFWAYIDSPQDYLNKDVPLTYDRPVPQIVRQLVNAIDAGELAPVPEGNMHWLRPDKLGINSNRIDSVQFQKIFYILRHYLENHDQGFISVSSIDEAKLVEKIFSRMKGKKFSVISSDMKSDEQEKVLNKFRNGEINYLVSVKMLDEGIDVPNMSLYIDLNLSLGLRQALQRMGRVLRPFYGKTGVEVVSFVPLDTDSLIENFSFYDSIKKGEFSGGIDRKNSTRKKKHTPDSEFEYLSEEAFSDIDQVWTEARRFKEERELGITGSPLDYLPKDFVVSLINALATKKKGPILYTSNQLVSNLLPELSLPEQIATITEGEIAVYRDKALEKGVFSKQELVRLARAARTVGRPAEASFEDLANREKNIEEIEKFFYANIDKDGKGTLPSWTSENSTEKELGIWLFKAASTNNWAIWEFDEPVRLAVVSLQKEMRGKNIYAGPTDGSISPREPKKSSSEGSKEKTPPPLFRSVDDEIREIEQAFDVIRKVNEEYRDKGVIPPVRGTGASIFKAIERLYLSNNPAVELIESGAKRLFARQNQLGSLEFFKSSFRWNLYKDLSDFFERTKENPRLPDPENPDERVLFLRLISAHRFGNSMLRRIPNMPNSVRHELEEKYPELDF
ncbi:MAG: DEAD/DEAH box helicase [Bacteriovoracia bacterium]